MAESLEAVIARAIYEASMPVGDGINWGDAPAYTRDRCFTCARAALAAIEAAGFVVVPVDPRPRPASGSGIAPMGERYVNGRPMFHRGHRVERLKMAGTSNYSYRTLCGSDVPSAYLSCTDDLTTCMECALILDAEILDAISDAADAVIGQSSRCTR